MKRAALISALACLLLAGPAMADATLRLDSLGHLGTYSGYYAADFNVRTWGVAGVPDGVSFKTFCVELHEDVGYDLYDAVVNTGAIKGNGGGDGSFDDLEPTTAWLYNEFLLGHLGTLDENKAKDIQLAIWYLESEITVRDATAGQTALIQAAENSTWAANDYIGDIRVLNLYAYNSDHTLDSSLRQDVLVKVPAPGAIVLGMIGLGLVGWLKKRSA